MPTALRPWRAGAQRSDVGAEGVDWKRQFAHDLTAALPAWLVARVLVAVALVLAHPLYSRYRPQTSARLRLRQGLLAWDADWFLRIATEGYAALPRPSLRYFPLLPLLGRGLSWLLLGNVRLSLLVLANLFALLAGALLHRLALKETGDESLARRATWLLALAPPSFVLVMGYTESLAILLALAGFLALRGRRWGWAAVAGFFSGLARPLGVVLAIPAAIEALPGLRRDPPGRRLARMSAIVAPVAGCATYLVWVGLRFGDALLPYTSQQTPEFRGGIANPLVTVGRTLNDLVSGRIATKNVPHLPWVVVLTILVVVVCRRWPAAYASFAVLTLMVALSTERWGSFERYVFACFPVVLALASLTSGRWVRRVTLGVSAGLMTMYATLTFLALYVP